MNVRSTGFVVALFLWLGCCSAIACRSQAPPAEWPAVGGDAGGQRYSTAHAIDKSNVTHLAVAWTYHTGALGPAAASDSGNISAFEATPVLFEGLLYLATPQDRVIAIHADTGQEAWRYDPLLKTTPYTSRGVALWKDAGSPAVCADRVFLGTLDARLIALDAKSGKVCESFGDHGQVDLHHDVGYRKGDYYAVTSPPTVVGDVVIVGSAIQDNVRVDMERGVVRAYDCRSGALLWTWDPIPWAMQQKLRTGAANAWTYFSADPEHGLVYVPTGSASPDFYGGNRTGDNRDANSVVALEAATGKRVWGFQTTHHDLWDYDVPSQPVLFTFQGKTPAIAITTKMGIVFVLNRLTGEPLFPVTERAVPQTDVPGETTSPTQPFSALPTLSPIDWPVNVLWGANAEDDRACREIVRRLRYEGIYTPPSLRGSLLFPGNIGGVNWGSPAFDPSTGNLYADTNRYAFSVTLFPRQHPIRERLDSLPDKAKIIMIAITIVALLVWSIRRRSLAWGTVTALALVGFAVLLSMMLTGCKREQRFELRQAHFGRESGRQLGTPYSMYREPLAAPSGKPCTPQPWGTVSAINLNTGKAVWQTPLGSLIDGEQAGTLNLGGPIVTAGGLVFTAASSEPYLRAFDAATGDELWKAPLPVPAQSTPMTYEMAGRQFVVVSAGGHGFFGTPMGDSVVAFALK